MYYFDEYAKKHNLEKQLEGFDFVIREDRMLIDGIDYRLDTYGWPDNRVVFSDKISGQHTIKRFGANGTENCREFLKVCLEVLGAEIVD